MTPALPPSTSGRARRWLLTLLRPGSRRLVLALLLFSLAEISALALPFALGGIVDAAGEGDGSAVLTFGAIAMGGLITAAALATTAAILLTFLLESVLTRVRQCALVAALDLSAETADGISAGELASRGSDDIEALREAVAGPIPQLASSAAAVAASLAGLVAIHPAFVLVVGLTAPVYWFAVRRYLRRAPRLYDVERAVVARRSSGLFEALHAREAIRAYGSEQQAAAMFTRRSWAVVRAALSIRVVQSRFFLRLGLAEMLGTVGLLFLGFALNRSGVVTLGEATTAMLVMLALFAPMSGLLLIADDLLAAGAALRRIVGLVDAGARSAPATGSLPRRADGHAFRPSPATTAECAVELASVSVQLGDVTALRDVSVAIKPGQVVAVVGASGAGKTTLARVLAGQLAPASGSVRVHGFDPLTLRGDAAAGAVAIVDQQPYVFAQTVGANLRLASASVSDEELRAVAERVGCGDTNVVPDEGIADGLAQRLALGRALLAGAPVLVFDEATAAVDAVRAGELDDLVRAACVGRTVLIVAHRLSQAERCDRVLVLDGGRIVEDGAPAALRESGGAYARLWRAWAAGADGRR